MQSLLAIYCAVAIAAQVDPGLDASNAEDARLFETARQRYYEAVEGRKGALEDSRDLLRKAHLKSPADPLILAYYGSARLLESARILAPWRKGKLAKEGLQMLDKAVVKSPENLEIRFLRAVSASHLPGFFKRREQSQSDFAWLAPRVPAAVASGRLDKRLGAAALYHHGVALHRSHDRSGAQAAWHEAVRIGPGTRAGTDAQKKLGGLPE